MTLQQQHVEDEVGRRAYERLVQQLQQSMSALGSRLAVLEGAAERDASNPSQVQALVSLFSFLQISASSFSPRGASHW